MNASALCVLNIKEGENAENLCFLKAVVYVMLLEHGTTHCAACRVPEGAHVCSRAEQLLYFSIRLLRKPRVRGKEAALFRSVFTPCLCFSW